MTGRCGITREIDRIGGGGRIEDTIASTSERCGLALIYGRADLRDGRSEVEAWERLNDAQQATVAIHAPAVATRLARSQR